MVVPYRGHRSQSSFAPRTFSSIELYVVIAIIAILASIAFPRNYDEAFPQTAAERAGISSNAASPVLAAQ